MTNDNNLPPAIGIIGIIGSISLEHVNTFIAILLGLVSLAYVSVRLWKEIKKEGK